MSKNLILFFMILFLNIASSFGKSIIKSGVNVSNFYECNEIWKLGIVLGFEKDVAIYKDLTISGGLDFTTKSGFIGDLPIYTWQKKEVISYDLDIKISYLEIPFLLKISLPNESLKSIQFVGGYSFSIALFDNSTKSEKESLFSYDPQRDYDKPFDTDPTRYGINQEAVTVFNSTNSGFVFGLRYNFSKMGIEIKYRNDIKGIGPIDYISDIDKKLKTISLLLTYSFS
jgi:hypothetical protein